MPEASFWYESNGEQKGPVPAAQLKQMAMAGELKPTDMIWREGQPDWVAAGTVKGLFPEGTPGVAPPPPPPSSQPERSTTQGMYGPAPDLRQATAAAKEASQQAMGAAKLLLNDPIGGIAEAYNSLGPSKALPVGIVFIVVLFVSHLLISLIGSHASYIPSTSSFQFEMFFWGFMGLVLFVGALLGVCTLIRMKTNPETSFSADVFLVGTSILPLGLGILVVGVLNAILKEGMFREIIDGSIMIFAETLMVFFLFSGLTKIHKVTERAATLFVPLMLIAGVAIAQLLWYMVVKAKFGL
jgi:hypothetical protein